MKDSSEAFAITKERKLEFLKKPWFAGTLILLGIVVLVFVMMISVTQGAMKIPLSIVVESLFHFDSSNSQHLIIRDLRMPRVIASALVGAALAVAGAIMQGTTRNPLADSGLLGINAGAGFMLAICFASFPGISYLQLMLFSFLGAGIAAGIVNGFAATRGGSAMRLVLSGIAVSAMFTALSQGIALYFNVAQDMMFWTMGGVAACNWDQIKIIVPCIIIALLFALLLAPQITLLNLGEEVANGLGVNTALVRAMCSLTVLILAGTAVSVVGSVGFIGLVVPHLSRRLVGVDFRSIIPVSTVLGALLLVLADLGARTLNPPFELPIGALIALIGVPFFLHIARTQGRVS